MVDPGLLLKLAFANCVTHALNSGVCWASCELGLGLADVSAEVSGRAVLLSRRLWAGVYLRASGRLLGCGIP